MSPSVKRPKAKIALFLVLLLYLILAAAYSVVVPVGRGADEWAHFWYAQFIAGNQRLPASIEERQSAGYKSDWPPLYHLSAAAVTGWVKTNGPPSFKYRADSLRRHLVPAQGPEAILHTEDELFFWRQEILVWHLGRFLSIAFSAGTLLVTYFIALEMFGAGSRNAEETGDVLHSLRFISPQTMALTATAVLAFNPRFLFTGMLFNYDSLTLLLSSLFLWLAIRVVKGYCLRRGFFGLGALAGLAFVTKYLTALLPLVILFVAWSKRAGEQSDKGARGRLFWVDLGQAALAYLPAVGWWFAYLITTFHEIDKYGLFLGTLSPLIRGDGSDRTVETIFAWLSAGQAPPPAYIAQQSYTAWQTISSFFVTFWGNPVVKPYPLNGFVGVMALIMGMAIIGGIIVWRQLKQGSLYRRVFTLMILYTLLPLPFMLIRLFGARDALEAVQGRHILFLSGAAVAVLLVTGLTGFVVWIAAGRKKSSTEQGAFSFTRRALLLTNYVLPLLLFVGAIAQLRLMQKTYPPLLPVQTYPYSEISANSVPPVSLPGGATLLDYQLEPMDQALRVAFVWQGGESFSPEDYQVEMQLAGDVGPAAGWNSYQTQARYPTRIWEFGDVIRDEGWLPLTGVAAGDYKIRWRLVSNGGPLFNWQLLAPYTLYQMTGISKADVTIWQTGEPTKTPPVFNERETIQVTFRNRVDNPDVFALVGPDDTLYPPVAVGPGWANFIVQPHWPPGNYRIQPGGETMLHIAPGHRNFQLPEEMTTPTEANFAGQIKLLGYRLPAKRLDAGSALPITLYWQGLEWMGEEFVIFTRLLDNQGLAWGGYDRLAKENYSTLLWSPAEIVTDGFAVPVNPLAPDGIYWLNVGWYQKIEGEAHSLEIINPETGEPTGATSVTLGPVKIGGPPKDATVNDPAPQVIVNQTLGNIINLLGYDISMYPGNGQPTAVKITFYWQALTAPTIDYTVFVHIRNAAGETVAQKDSPPVGGIYPTALWDAGEIIKDILTVPIDGLEPGQYEIVVGLYNFSTGTRLPVTDSPDGVMVLQTFNVGGK